jgi:hypothetical protein
MSPETQQAVLRAIPSDLGGMEERRVFRLLQGISGLRMPLNSFSKSMQLNLLESLAYEDKYYNKLRKVKICSAK